MPNLTIGGKTISAWNCAGSNVFKRARNCAATWITWLADIATGAMKGNTNEQREVYPVPRV
jgi:hypothetical protein